MCVGKCGFTRPIQDYYGSSPVAQNGGRDLQFYTCWTSLSETIVTKYSMASQAGCLISVTQGGLVANGNFSVQHKL